MIEGRQVAIVPAASQRIARSGGSRVAAGAGIVYAIVARRFARPARPFLAVATVVLLLSLGCIASLPISPAEQAALVAVHMVSAGAIAGAITLLAALPGSRRLERYADRRPDVARAASDRRPQIPPIA